MQVAQTIAAVREALDAARREARRIDLVPTMGALHAGHLSLVDAARRRGGCVVVSIFVNPTQFGPREDYHAYPRNLDADLDACRAAGVDVVFAPSVEEIYRPDRQTTIHVASVTERLCGPHRPGHFDGVALVVTKLFNIVRPHAAYFGEKDYQQLVMIRRLARDLDLDIEIVGCPIVREPDGLALSSRNAYLSAAERQRALAIYRALQKGADLVARGQRQAPALEAAMRNELLAAQVFDIDYTSVVDAETLAPVERVERPAVLAIAARIGRTRLIDNVRVE